MKKGVIAAVAAAFVCCVALPALATDDWNMWNSYAFKIPIIKKKLYWATKFETRFRDDMDEFFRYHFYLGPEYKLFKHFTVAVKYGNIQSGDPGDFHTEHRFMFHAIPKFKLKDLGVDRWKLGDLTLKVDNRLDWRIRYHKAHAHSFRYKLYPKLSYPVYKSEKLTISPFAKEAFYFPLDDSIYFNAFRTYGGLSFTLFKHVKLDLYYMWLNERHGRGGDWTGDNVLGTGLAYDF